MQMLRRRKKNDKNEQKNDADQYDNDVNSRSDGFESAESQHVCNWKDFQRDEFLTFYVGNRHYNTNCYQVKKLFRRPYAWKPFQLLINWS